MAQNLFSYPKKITNLILHFYHPRMRVGNNFSWVCLFVCLCFCLCICAGCNFWTVEGRNFILVHIDLYNIFTISRLCLSTNVIGFSSRSNKWIKFHNSHNSTTCLYSTKACSNIKVIGWSMSFNVKVTSTSNNNDLCPMRIVCFQLKKNSCKLRNWKLHKNIYIGSTKCAAMNMCAVCNSFYANNWDPNHV